MPASETLTMPDGSEFTIVRSAADSERDPSEIAFSVLPDGAAPPLHVHPRQSETFTALEGDSFELQLNGEWRALAAGESATIPAGQAHTFRNKGGSTVRVTTVHAPGLSFETYIRRLHATAVAHGTSSIDPATLVRMAVLWNEHSETIRAAQPPVRVAMTAMTQVGRLVGLRPEA